MRKHAAPLLYCPHGRPAFADPDCPQCVQEQYERWKASEAARETGVEIRRRVVAACLASDPEPHEGEVTEA